MHLRAYIPQGAKIFDRKSYAVEQGDLLCLCAACALTGDNPPELCDGMGGFKLLNFTLNPCLWWIFDKNIGSEQNIPVQFRFAGTIATDGIDMDPGADHIIGQNGSILLVGRARRDNLCPFDGVLGAGTTDHFYPLAGKVLHRLCGRGRIDIL